MQHSRIKKDSSVVSRIKCHQQLSNLKEFKNKVWNIFTTLYVLLWRIRFIFLLTERKIHRFDTRKWVSEPGSCQTRISNCLWNFVTATAPFSHEFSWELTTEKLADRSHMTMNRQFDSAPLCWLFWNEKEPPEVFAQCEKIYLKILTLSGLSFPYSR